MQCYKDKNSESLFINHLPEILGIITVVAMNEGRIHSNEINSFTVS